MRKGMRVGLMVALMVATFALATAHTQMVRPVSVAAPIDLEAMIPLQFGDWKSMPLHAASVVNPQEDALARQIYTQTLTRLYRNQLDGQFMMLVIAYGADQRDALQVHYPEVCYPAQGFEVQSNIKAQVATGFGLLPVRQLQTRLNARRNEPVTYWAMLGDQVVLDGLQKKLTEVRMAWAGARADGLLFRVSTVDEKNERAFAGQHQFISELLATLPAADRRRLSGQ